MDPCANHVQTESSPLDWEVHAKLAHPIKSPTHQHAIVLIAQLVLNQTPQGMVANYAQLDPSLLKTQSANYVHQERYLHQDRVLVTAVDAV